MFLVSVVCSWLWYLCSRSVVVELVLCYCGPSTNPETHMLRAIQQPATENKQARHRLDILHSGSVGAQPRPQPTLSEIEKSSAAPTRHPHHVITHNTQHQIFNVYNRRLSSPAAASTTRLQAVWSHLAGHSEILCPHQKYEPIFLCLTAMCVPCRG